MPRNGSGTFTPTQTFTAGTTAVAADVNSVISDIGTALTNSVATDGQTAMTGQFPAASGTIGAPGYSFNGDLNTGIYRVGADSYALVCNGVAVATLTETGFALGTGVALSGGSGFSGKVSGLGSTPVGAVMDYAGTSAPSGWLLCYGQAISRTTYSALFSAIGTTHGTGDGSTTFNVPDFRGRVGAGRDDMGGAAASRLTSALTGIDGTALGNAGGLQTHTLTQAQLPNYNLSLGSLTVTVEGSATVIRYPNSLSAGAGGTSVPQVSGAETVSFTGSIGGTLASGGSSNAHNNTQPTIIMNKIIYTGVA